MKSISIVVTIILANVFSTFAQAPVISSYSPLSGEPGATVTVLGNNFDATAANNIVYFGAAPATVLSSTSTSLSVTIPFGATHNFISVRTTSGIALSNSKFIPTFSFCGSPNISGNSWNAAVSFVGGSSTLGALAIADIDGDGRNDIVTDKFGGNLDSVWILRNQSTTGVLNATSFATKVGFSVGGSAGKIIVADIDADGKKDIIVENGEYGTTWTFRIFRNTSTTGVINSSSLAPPVTYTLASSVGYPKGFDVGDINGDGKLDIAMRDPSIGYKFIVFKNQSTPGTINGSSFASDVSYLALDPATGTSGDKDIVLADIDKDGKSDVIISVSGTINVIRSTSTTGTISFAGRQEYTCGGSQTWAKVADFNNDGKLDIIQHSFTGTFYILENQITAPGPLNTNSFAAQQVFSGDFYALGDMDGDGRVDIGVGSNVLKNNNTGGAITNTTFGTATALNNGMFGSQGCELGDLDNDNKPEIININSSNVEVYKYSGALSVPTPDICMVSVDEPSNFNEIYWDKTLYPNLDSMVIWRETTSNTYKRIGAVHQSALSMYIDTARSIGPANGNPNIGTYRYKIQIRDICGNYSQKSLWHNTVFFINSSGTFFWNEYKIEGSPIPTNPMTQFDLVRDDFAPTGNYNTVGTVAGTQTTLNDPFYPAYVNTADWRVYAYGLNCEPTMRIAIGDKENDIQTVFVKSKSNIKNNRTVGIQDSKNQEARLKVYPNPANDLLNVEVSLLNDKEATIVIENMLGQVVYTIQTNKPMNSINTSNLISGVYFVKVGTAKGVVVEKVSID